MSDVNKYKFILSEGEYIGVRSYYNYAINLYLHQDTFYEVWYFNPTNKIEKITPLENEKTLDLNISQMNKTRSK